MNFLKDILKTILVFSFLSAAALPAQNMDGYSLGLAGNANSMARGIEAIFWNPANLSMYRPNRVEINFIALNTSLNNSAFSLSDYNRFFSLQGHGGQWNDADKKALLAKVGPGGLQFGAGLSSNLFGLAIGSYGIGVQLIGNVNGRLSANNALRVFLFGENFDKEYDFQESKIVDGQLFSAAKVAFATSHLFRLNRHKYWVSHIAVGFSLNYYAGLAYAQTLESNVRVRRINDGAGLAYQAVLRAQTADITGGSLAGSGFGLDLGASIRFKRAWNFSFSVSNLFAAINWTGNTRILTYTRSDSAAVGALSGANLKETNSYAAGDPFSTTLPARMQFGLSLRLLRNLTLTSDWHQSFSGDINTGTTSRLGFGVEYKPFTWLPLRSGVAFGGPAKSLWAVGAGVHAGIINFDLSYALIRSPLPMRADGFYTAATFKIAY